MSSCPSLKLKGPLPLINDVYHILYLYLAHSLFGVEIRGFLWVGIIDKWQFQLKLCFWWVLEQFQSSGAQIPSFFLSFMPFTNCPKFVLSLHKIPNTFSLHEQLHKSNLFFLLINHISCISVKLGSPTIL